MHRKLPIITSCLLLTVCMRLALCEQKPGFSVKDDIAIAKFGDIAISPDEAMVVAHTEQSSLQDGMMHEAFRVYNLKAIREAVNALDQRRPIEPVWSFDRALKDVGGNSDRVSRVKWLADGSGFAFLLQVDQYHHLLYLAKVDSTEVVPLSAEGDDVLGFDVRDQLHYVFTVASHEAETKLKDDSERPFRVGTGHYLTELAFSEEASHIIQRGELWAATGGVAKPVKDHTTGAPISFFYDGNNFLALSPDGRTLVTVQAVENVPTDWEKRFPPPFPNNAYRLKAHHQDLTAALDGYSYVEQWVSIALADGYITSLTNAPISARAGWIEVYASPAWSDDGSSILLPGTFNANQSEENPRPCISVVRIASRKTECVRPLKRNLASGFEAGFMSISGVLFVHGDDNRIVLEGIPFSGAGITTPITYARSSEGSWRLEETKSSAHGGGTSLQVKVRQTFKDPPVLVATDLLSKKSKIILDPNPQLNNIAFGEPELYNWQDEVGHKWRGILYKPVGYSANVKYPLVIQNHGFSVNLYEPSGGIPNAFVAQELASAGIMVLHVADCDGRATPLEGPCNVEEYESAVKKLSQDGLIDSSRVGIIGYSRTVYYVLEALTTSKIRFRAASITDGISYSYMNYLETVDQPGGFHNEEVKVIGAKPFGSGFAEWLKSSPVFSLDKVVTPLRVVAPRGSGVIEMWEPYALLEDMDKPVDLIVINTHEHVLADPIMRMVTQGGNIDWFRFWLQDYEYPDPAKQEQYVRWRQLRQLQDANDKIAGRIAVSASKPK